MEINDKVLDYLEQYFPDLAETATKQAYWQALASGSSVVIADEDTLIEVFPDGTKKVIKKIQPSILVQKGQKIQLK